MTHNVYLSSEIPVFINMYNCPVEPGNLIDEILAHFTFHYVLPGGSYSPPGTTPPKPIPQVVDTVHERVKFSISQEATLERDAFAACLELTNKLTDKNIEGVKVDLNIKNEDSSDASDMFFVNLTFLNNINSIDGSGVINPSAVAIADWLLVPKPGTGGTDSAGIDYTVHAFINYTVGGVPFSVNSTEEKINVMPQPLLNLTYTIPGAVKADTPFNITLNVTNVGYGIARNLKLDSAQPVIYDNKAGLLVSFNLIGSGIVGGTASDSMLINFGDIAPGESKTAYWIMTASLDGEFTEFKGSFSHNSALGGDETSLIKNIAYIYVSDTTPPIVSSVSPEDNATGVKIDTTVTATFNEAMNSSTITTNSFTLTGSVVSGIVIYDSGTYTATFIPDANLEYNHEYTATLSTDITDEVGNSLAEEYTWSFTTELAPAQSEQPQLKAPWKGTKKITQGNYGSYTHYDHGTWDNTYAIDVASNYESVLAPAEGIVIYVDSDEGGLGGKELAIEHTGPTGKKFVTVYLHLSDIFVKDGEVVNQGHVIANSGATGEVTGPHLHFHMWRPKGSEPEWAYDSHTMPIERLVLKQVGVDSDFREYDARKGDLNDTEVAGKFFESNTVPIIEYNPNLTIPVYTPFCQQAHKGTELTYTIKVTNEGDLTDTITLSPPSDTRGWDIQLSETSVTLAPGESTKVYLYLTIEEYAASNRITITGTSQGDTSKTSSCQVTASGIGEGQGLFAATLRFRNIDAQDHTLTLNVPDYVKISDETFTLNPSENKPVNVVFDPKPSESDISTIYIDVTDITSGESESIPITFESYEIIATSFDMATDSYSFRNWGIELEIADFVLTGNCYGMSETSILYFRRIIERPDNKQNTYMLEKDEAKWKIRLHQWRGNMFLSSLAIPSADKEEEYKSLEEHIENGIPMLLNMQEPIPWGIDNRHTVVAYKIIKKGDKAHISLYENEELYNMSQLNFYDALPYATYNISSTDFYYRGFTQFLVSDAERHPFEQIILVVNCPVNVTITDQYDRIISDDGTNEIPDAIIIAANEEKLFYLPAELTYHVDINAYDAGKFTATEVSHVSDNTATINVFDNISITENTHATLDIVPNEVNPMKIDYDGDGTIDEERYPDVNETIEINQPPNASFIYSPAYPVVNETIIFNASESKDHDGNITNYEWEFGNGIITDTTGPIINQFYALAGEYTVNLTVTDDDGAMNSTSQWIHVALGDITPPNITNVTATNITTNSVTITWATDELSDSLVKYGTESGNYTVQNYNSTNVTSHTVNLTELLSNTTYYYLVNSTDASGNANESVEYNFTTAVISDTIPPGSVFNLGEIGKGNSWILWNWTNPSEPDFNHTEVRIDDEFMVNVTTPEHSYNATGLSPNTTYEIGTRTVDVSGNVNLTWMNDSAKTLLAPDITPPTITNVTAIDITTNSVTITWDTDEPSDSLVKYGTESGNYTVQKYNSTNVTSHTVNLTELLSNTTYYYLVNSTDARGNANESVEYNFTTAVISDTTPPGSVSNLGEIGKGSSWILWNWTNPSEPDFNHTAVWIDDEFNVNVTTPEHTYNATGLSASTTYEIGTRTVDVSGNVNWTWVNDTATTLIHDVNVSTDYAAATNGIKIKYNGTEIPASENLTIGDAYDIYYKIVNEGDYNETVNVSLLVANLTWTQTAATHTWNIKIGEYRYSGGDSWDTSALTPGEYMITVNASIPIDDNWLNNERIRAVILAMPSNQPPVADPSGPYNGTEGEVTQFNGSGSYDHDGSIYNYTWDFGDGNTGTGEKPTHTYAQNGTYTVTLNVTDNDGATDVNSTTAMIADTEPTANFYGTPRSGFKPLTVNFTDSSTSYDGIVAWDWNFGDGANSTEQNTSHVYTNAGLYNVTLTVYEDDGNHDSETKVDYITVTNQPPVADPNGPYNDTEGVVIQFNGSGSYDPDGTIVSYDWDFGDGNTSTGMNPTHTYLQNGTYTVSLNVTDDEGATDVNTTTATIDDTEPVADLSGLPTSGLEPLKVYFTDNSTSYDGITAWYWDFGDGTNSTEQNPSHTYSAGTYTVNLTVTEGDGDSDTETKLDYINVTRVNQPPVSDPDGPYNGMEGNVIPFNGSGSYDPDGSIYNYTWDFGDGSTGTGVSPTHTYAQNGNYIVTLNVTDDDGATDANSTTATIADTEPTANFSGLPTSGPEPLTVNFTDNSTSFDGIIAWEWDFGDGNTNNTQNPTHMYTTEGTYTVSLTVHEADGDSDTETKVDYINVIRVNQPPVSDPNKPYIGTEGEVILFDGSVSYDPDGTIVSYTWDFGDGNTSTGMDPTHTYAQNGTYTVTLNVTDNEGATDMNTTTATIADTGPTANFSASPTTGLKPLTVDFTDTSTAYDTIVSWTWDFGDGNTSTVRNPNNTYAAGIYTVNLTVTDADGDNDTETKVDYINVTRENQPPVADPNGPYENTEGVAILFDGSGSFDSDGSIANYTWDFGDGNTGTGEKTTHTYAQNGTYSVTLYVTDDDGATDVNSTTATIADTKPTANFSGAPTSGLEPLTVDFTDNSTSYDGITWAWDFGDGNTRTEQNPSHTYAAGTYTVNLTVTEADGDNDTETKVGYINVTRVNQPPVSDPNGPYLGTEGVAILFDCTASYDSDGSIDLYEWDFGDGSSGAGESPTHIYVQNGTYTVTLNVTDNDGATDMNTTTATIADTGPIANFSASSTTGLKPLTVDFTDNSTSYDEITAWAWDFGDGNNSNEQNPTHEYANAGLYNVTLTVYEADGNSDTEAKVDYITVTDGNGVNQPPVADANGPYTGVEGAPITYNGSGSYDPDGSIASYAWDFGDGNTGTGVSPDHTYAQEGTYTVTLVVNDGVLDSAPDATTATVTDTEPTADFNAVPTSGPEPLTVEFTDLSSSYDGIASWSWDFGDGETSNEQNPTHTYMSSGTYTVALAVTEADDDTATKEDYITVTPAGDTISPVIESVALDAYTTIPDATIHVTVEATDNVGVASVTADGVNLEETGSTWEADITAPSDTGDYTLTIIAEDEAENVAESAVEYSVVTPTGGLGVGISPRSTTASAGDIVNYIIIVSSTENFDDTIHVYMSMDGLPESYKLDMTAFDWVEQDVQIRAGEKKEIPLVVTVPAGETGRKVFRIKAESTCWTPNAYDSALITIT